MSDSSKLIENDDIHSNEPLDPRIQIELERANAATSEINNLETQLDDAQKLFQISFTNCKQRLADLSKTLGRCVERARPYYDACKKADDARIDTRKAAQEYQNSVELYCTAKENLIIAENQLSKSDNMTWTEYVNHITLKVIQSEREKLAYERIHQQKFKFYQEFEQTRMKLYRSLTRVIIKSKPYFDAKFKAENELKNQKSRFEDVQHAIIQAKRTYRTALNNLEQISDEIHTKRRNQIVLKLPQREPGVGAEKPDKFIELPLIEFSKVDLSDESSDNDISKSSNSISVNKSTDCIYLSSNVNISTNNVTSLTTKLFDSQVTTCSNNEYDRRFRKHSSTDKSNRMKLTRMLKSNETPLLSHLLGTHKFHSYPNLNV